MSFVIDGVNFKEEPAEKYWSFPSSFKGNPTEEVRNMIFSGDYLGARKMDGAYYRFIKDMEGNMILQGRSKSVSGDYLDKIDHVPHLMPFFESLPNGTCLLGEIYFPNNEGSSNVTTIMGCLTPKAIERQNKGDKLHYYIFDIWAWDGQSYLNTICKDRFENLHEFAKIYTNEYVEWAKYYAGRELWFQLQSILANDGEGIVMTKKGTVPQPGKRPARKTLKVKKELADNIDCFFTGRFSPPTRLYSGKEIKTWKYWENLRTGERLEGEFFECYHNGDAIEPVTKPYFHDWAGSLEIGVLKDNKVIPIGYLSGLADEIKAQPSAMKFKCIEVTAMEILPDTGALRHGKLKRFRPDLSPEDCTYEKYMG